MKSRFISRWFSLCCLFGLLAASRAVAASIAGAEYFIDADPGEGRGVALTALDGAYDAPVEMAEIAIDTALLPMGPHRVGVRFLTVFNEWGDVQWREFEVLNALESPVRPMPKATLMAAEYFIDIDPGEGNGFEIPPVDGSYDSVAEQGTISIHTDGLTAGIYRVGYRFQDNHGAWGHVQWLEVEIEGSDGPEPPASVTTLMGAEYFIDVDPGEGNGIAVQAVDGSFDAAVEEGSISINTGGLSAGMHRVGCRFQDSRGSWGDVQWREIEVVSLEGPEPPGSVATLGGAEFFIDVDPGEGHGIAIPAEDGAYDAVMEQGTIAVDTSGLSVGPHRLGLRFRDDAGDWGVIQWREIEVRSNGFPEPPEWPAVHIVAGEYFVDHDPGEGNGSPLQMEAGEFDSVVESLTLDIHTGFLSAGAHRYGVRFLDDQGRWGRVFWEDLQIEAASSYQVTFDLGERGTRTGGGELLQWVAPNGAATAPMVQPEAGWFFEGWDRSFSNVVTFVEVNAVYSPLIHAHVESEHGLPEPSVGTHSFGQGASLEFQAYGETVGSTQYICTGWTGSGSFPATGTGTTVQILLEEESSIVWLWREAYWLESGVHGSGGQVSVADDWYDDGSRVTITATADSNHHFTGWVGDTAGCAVNGPIIEVPMNRARSIHAEFAVDVYTVRFNVGEYGTITSGNAVQDVSHGGSAVEPQVEEDVGWSLIGWDTVFTNVTAPLTIHARYASTLRTLEVSSAHGSPDPAAGLHTYPLAGENLTCSVPGVVGGVATQYVCTGWAGSGSVPPAGTDTHVSFAITNNSTITWQWQTNYLFEASVVGGLGELFLTSGWCSAGSEAVVHAIPSNGYRVGHWLVDGEAGGWSTNGGDWIGVDMDSSHMVSVDFVVLDLPEALDNHALAWTTGGDSNWVAQTAVAADEVDAAGCVGLADSSSGWIETSIYGKEGGVLSFDWRVSCEERYDSLRLYIDGELRTRISGEVDWERRMFELPEGVHVIRWEYAKGKSGSSGQDAAWLDQVEWFAFPTTLGMAVENEELEWIGSGTADWLVDTNTTFDGEDAVVSGEIGDYGWSRLATTVLGPGTCTFQWRVSSEEGCDWYDFLVDGELIDTHSGESGWQEVSVPIAPGIHELAWEYWKDESLSEGADCGWLDQVVWTGEPLAGIALWLSEQGLRGELEPLYRLDSDNDGIINIFDYAFGSNLQTGHSMLDLKLVDGSPVVEIPATDMAAREFVNVRVLGSTNLFDWTLPVEVYTNQTGMPENRAWYHVPNGPDHAFFRLEAEVQ